MPPHPEGGEVFLSVSMEMKKDFAVSGKSGNFAEEGD